MAEATFQCSGCGDNLPRSRFHEFNSPDRKRPVTARCRGCRREDRYALLYPDEVCGTCRLHRPLEDQLDCRRCLAEAGLRVCTGPCGKLLPLFLSFFGRARVCKACQKKS
jgi:hypothetical protein